MTTSEDPLVLFIIEWISKRSLKLDIRDFVQWLDNQACETNTFIEFCYNDVCDQGSVLNITGVTKTETLEVLVKFSNSETEDRYERKILINKVFGKEPPDHILKQLEVLYKTKSSNSTVEASSESESKTLNNVTKKEETEIDKEV